MCNAQWYDIFQIIAIVTEQIVVIWPGILLSEKINKPWKIMDLKYINIMKVWIEWTRYVFLGD